MNNISKKVALIDADGLVYRNTASVQRNISWDEDEISTLTDVDGAIRLCEETIEDWTQRAGCTNAILCFSGKVNFRKHILPSYKTHRTAPKPLAFQETRTRLEGVYEHLCVDGLEADDVLGIWGTSGAEDYVLVSTDKDLQTVPSWFFNPIKDSAARYIDIHDADRFWMMQTLCGDTADNYKGCPGVGPAKAAKILPNSSALGTMWPHVRKAFSSAGMSEEIAVQQARCARILRHEDYNEQRGTIELWHPTSPQTFSLRSIIGD